MEFSPVQGIALFHHILAISCAAVLLKVRGSFGVSPIVAAILMCSTIPLATDTLGLTGILPQAWAALAAGSHLLALNLFLHGAARMRGSKVEPVQGVLAGLAAALVFTATMVKGISILAPTLAVFTVLYVMSTWLLGFGGINLKGCQDTRKMSWMAAGIVVPFIQLAVVLGGAGIHPGLRGLAAYLAAGVMTALGVRPQFGPSGAAGTRPLRLSFVYSVLLFIVFAFMGMLWARLDWFASLIGAEGEAVRWLGAALGIILFMGLETKCRVLSARLAGWRGRFLEETVRDLQGSTTRLMAVDDLVEKVCTTLQDHLGGIPLAIYLREEGAWRDNAGKDEAPIETGDPPATESEGVPFRLAWATNGLELPGLIRAWDPMEQDDTAGTWSGFPASEGAAVFPMLDEGRPAGALLITDGSLLDETAIGSLAAFAGHAAVAISNARLYADLMRSCSRLSSTLRDLETAQSKLVQAEKLAALGRLASQVAHEIRNPLGTIKVSAATVSSSFEKGHPYRELVDFIVSEVDRLNRVVGDLLDFAKPKGINRVDCKLKEVMDRCRVMMLPRAEDKGVTLEFNIQIGSFSIDPDRIIQLSTNLLANAIDASPKGGTVRVGCLEMGNDLIIAVSDEGEGVAAEDMEKVFEPFHTTKAKGTGLGLAVCRQIIESHGGVIRIFPGLDASTGKALDPGSPDDPEQNLRTLVTDPTWDFVAAGSGAIIYARIPRNSQ